MIRKKTEFVRPQKRLSWLYYLPWIGAFVWAAIAGLRVATQGFRFDIADLQGAVVGAALGGFLVAAVAAMFLAALMFVLGPIYVMVRQVVSRVFK